MHGGEDERFIITRGVGDDRVGRREGDMAMYEPIKGCEHDDEERGMTNPMMMKNNNISIDHDEDVEMAIQQISKSTSASSAAASASACGGGGAAAYKNVSKEEAAAAAASLPSKLRQQQQQRLVSLDVFRGFTVAIMILVDDVGGILPAINHSPWNGLTLADLVMPFFLFMVGVSLSLTYKKMSCRTVATRKTVLRTLKLLALGLFLQGGYFHGIKDLTFGVDIEQMRWMGILQRIAIAYFVAALCEIWLKGDDNVNSGRSLLRKYRFQWSAALIITVLYLSLLYGLHVPDWEYQIPGVSSSAPKTFSVKCGVRGDTGPACNAVGMIDRKILGLRHLYRRPIYARTEQCSINSPDNGPLPADAPSWCQAPFDPEGLLSSMMAIVTCLVGLHYGHIIVHFKSHRDRILRWSISSSSLIILGLALDLLGMHINKPLYTFSYMCITAGSAGILFTAIYLMVDVCGYRRPTIVMEWMGMHALMIFVLVACNLLPVIIHGFYWGKPQNNILSLIGIGK
ncbi:PREDICTED: heparan-alpha-glucosaminide N-acetyltransferase isoform X1 [Prunus mume]|uniref:Heparan-alpha-glucosaminide N-acetyltransferase isoform X1 n=2 Tax=Prunus mume TaxID=102107 RepID=A0ABM1LKS0_PRUMU|nr:PREDICTED: heparan-alpha-glucosaminide N-acetyltransferase isoform X1 [Prunus mume]